LYPDFPRQEFALAFTKAKQSGLVENLVEQIQDAIISGNYQPGEKLPSSNELQELFGISRGTLREAFRILAHKGLIEVRTGVKGGVFAKEAAAESVSESLWLLIRQRQISLDDLYGFREVVEEGLIRLVIRNVQPEDLQELKSLLSEMHRLVPQGPPAFRKLLRVERRIRGAFIRISQSKMYESVLNAIWDNLHSYAKRYLPIDEGMSEESYEDWRIIISGIEHSDPDRASEQIKDHLRRFAAHYKRGFKRYHETEEPPAASDARADQTAP
jgi:DNA-binding FadR family transcriptional regulator